MRRGVGLALVLVLAAACSDDGGPSTAEIDPDTGLVEGLPPLPGPGADLLDGFVVPEDAALVGGVFPVQPSLYRGRPPESSWSTELVVVGDPRVVLDDFLDQATGQGLEVKSNCAVEPDRVSCSAHARRLVDGSEEEQISFSAARSATGRRAFISYERWPPDVVPEDRARWDDVQDQRWTPSTPQSFPPLEAPPPLPGVGDPPVAGRTDVGELVLPAGVVVAQPVGELDCGFDVLLFIPGDLEPVVADLERQFATWEFVEQDTRRATVQGIDVVRVGAGGEGGGDLTFEAVIGRDGDPSWARLSRCEDF